METNFVESLQWLLFNGYDVAFHNYNSPGMGFSETYTECTVIKRLGEKRSINFRINKVSNTEFVMTALEYVGGDAINQIAGDLKGLVYLLQNPEQ